MATIYMKTKIERIHPALEYTTEHASGGQKYQERRKELLQIIKDDGKASFFRDDTQQQDGMELIHFGLCIEPRWSEESIATFCRGETRDIKKELVFQRVKEIVAAHVELPDKRFYDFLTLWSIGTYFSPLFNTYPYVYVGGISGSGKTKLLTLCSHICFNSALGSNISTPTIFRLVQNTRCSLFIDETENLASKHMAEEFRNLLLNGYKKGLRTYRTRRTEDDNFVPEAFEVYGPKMLANIEGIEEVLESRCVTITMRRSTNREVTSREVEENNPIWQQVRDMIYPFMMTNWKAVKQTYSEFKNDTTLVNRDLELWKPILSLAQFFDNGLLTEMKAFAVEVAELARMEDSGSNEYVLVEALLSIVEQDGYYEIQEIKNEMTSFLEESAWLTNKLVGTLLRRLGFIERRRVNGRSQYFLKASEVRQLAHDLGIATGNESSGHSSLSELITGKASNSTNPSNGGQQT